MKRGQVERRATHPRFVFPEQPGQRHATPALSLKLHREAFAEAVDPDTAIFSKLVAPTQEGGSCRIPAQTDTDDGTFNVRLGSVGDLPRQ